MKMINNRQICAIISFSLIILSIILVSIYKIKNGKKGKFLFIGNIGKLFFSFAILILAIGLFLDEPQS